MVIHRVQTNENGIRCSNILAPNLNTLNNPKFDGSCRLKQVAILSNHMFVLTLVGD